MAGVRMNVVTRLARRCRVVMGKVTNLPIALMLRDWSPVEFHAVVGQTARSRWSTGRTDPGDREAARSPGPKPRVLRPGTQSPHRVVGADAAPLVGLDPDRRVGSGDLQ